MRVTYPCAVDHQRSTDPLTNNRRFDEWTRQEQIAAGGNGSNSAWYSKYVKFQKCMKWVNNFWVFVVQKDDKVKQK